MNRRSFLRKAVGGAAGVGAVVLGAKNIGSPSIPDRKELDDFQVDALRARWTDGFRSARQVRQTYINQPYAWGDPVYATEVRMNFSFDARPSAQITWSDGYQTTHAMFARQNFDDVRIWSHSPKSIRVAADEKSVEVFDTPYVMGDVAYSVYAPKTMVSADGIVWWELDEGNRLSDEAKLLSYTVKNGEHFLHGERVPVMYGNKRSFLTVFDA